MTYNPNIPAANDVLSDSQGQIQGNFQRADSSFGTDHYEFSNLTTNNGKHKKVTWLDQSAAIPAAEPNAVLAYANTQSAITMPYYKRDNLATVFPLAPIKAYATFALTGAPKPYLAVIDDGFNVATITISAPGSGTATIALSNPMRTITYGVLVFSSGGLGVNFKYTIINNSSFAISGVDNALRITFAVLET